MSIISQDELNELARASVARLVRQPKPTTRTVDEIDADIDAEAARIRSGHWTADFNRLVALRQERTGAIEGK